MDEDPLVQALRRRAQEAAADAEARAREAAVTVAEAQQFRRRSLLLRTLVHRLQEDPQHLPRHCAWCGRMEIDGTYVESSTFLQGELPARLRARATHGICPDCMARQARTGTDGPTLG